MSEVQESTGRRKTIELNLVPFIDLMSVLITFLLLTAVWTQVSLIQIGSSVYGKQNFQDAVIKPPEDDVVLKLEIKSQGYNLVMGKKAMMIPLRQGVFDDSKLQEVLQDFKRQYPQKTNAAIAMADDLPYERLIKGMDGFIKSGFPAIDVLTGGP